MKKILLTFAFLALLCCCGERTDQVVKPEEHIMHARLKVRIECSRPSVMPSEPIKIMIMMQKMVDDEIEVPTAYWSAIVCIDGKEFKRPWVPGGGPKGDIMDTSWAQPPWSGPGFMSKNSEVGVALKLSEYGISKEILSVGKHEVVVIIDNVKSNILTIKVLEDR